MPTKLSATRATSVVAQPLPATPAPQPGRLTTSEAVCLFAFAGKATLTLESAKTGARFTYKVVEGKKPGFHLVSVLTGSDNESDFQYLGFYHETEYTHGAKSRIKASAPSAVAFAFFAQALRRPGPLPLALRVYHEGRCGACNRKLTVPESILTGLGPECSDRLGVVRAKIACTDPFGLVEAA